MEVYDRIADFEFGILYDLKSVAKEYGETEDYILNNIDIIRFKKRLQLSMLENICNADYAFLNSLKNK